MSNEMPRLHRGTKCRLHGGGVGSRRWLGDEHGPVRIAVCPVCDIPAAARTDGAVLIALPATLHEIVTAHMKAG